MLYASTVRISNLGRVNGKIITGYPAVEPGQLRVNKVEATG